jgi:hypothetical protein
VTAQELLDALKTLLDSRQLRQDAVVSFGDIHEWPDGSRASLTEIEAISQGHMLELHGRL